MPARWWSLAASLFVAVTPGVLYVGRHVKVVTSNFHRTLFSAWSFLYGMFPGVPCSFKLPSERFNVNYGEIRKLCVGRRVVDG